MKTLKNHLILYDAECPMCNLYTSAFVKTEMLDENGRKPYQEMPKEICGHVDFERAVNEIALINTVTGEVTYGIKSLFKVIGNAFPFFKPVFDCTLFNRVMEKVYAFISSNRKIIIPAKSTNPAFEPTFKLNYRFWYLLFATFFSAWILNHFSKLITDFVPPGNYTRELMICGGQIIFQSVVLLFNNRQKLWDYLGNMMTVSVFGSLLLIPLLLIASFSNNQLIALVYFGGVVFVMLAEHIRRTKLMNLNYWPSLTWVLYRVIVLTLILELQKFTH